MLKKNIHEFPEWLNWLHFNLQRQCNPKELSEILIENHFSEASINEVLHATCSQSKDIQSQPDPIDYLKLSKPYFSQNPYSPDVQQVKTEKLQLYLIYDFLSAHECSVLIELSKRMLVPSTLTIPSTDKYFRTSQTANLRHGDDPIISIIDNKISHCLGIGEKYAEVTQIQCYEVGQQFKKHTDFFEPNTNEYRQFASERGNRTWTFMIYLNSVEQGGETTFPAIEYTIKPEQGLAVIWNNLYPNGNVNHDSLHSGLPVMAGKKFVITKWYRERKA